MANFTKPAIKASFMKLLNERPLNKISVRDIVEDCGINRNSFYYHFQDIPALLGEIITEETEKLITKTIKGGTRFAKEKDIHIFDRGREWQREIWELCSALYLETKDRQCLF